MLIGNHLASILEQYSLTYSEPYQASNIFCENSYEKNLYSRRKPIALMISVDGGSAEVN